MKQLRRKESPKGLLEQIQSIKAALAYRDTFSFNTARSQYDQGKKEKLLPKLSAVATSTKQNRAPPVIIW